MAKKILLIENDSAFAGQLAESLEASGFDVRVAPEGKGGMDLAREWGPDAIVLCVELPGMSGYLVCQKLRKDDATRSIPLILTSAEATPDTFEKHRALKVRADEYLIKPFVPGALLEKLGAVGLPSQAAPQAPEPWAAGELEAATPAQAPEEVVGLDEEMGLDALSAEPSTELPSLDLEALPDEPTADAPAAHAVDDDLAFLDEAFEGIAAPPTHAAREEPVGEDELSAAADSLPIDDDSAARAELGDLDLSGDDPLAELGEVEGLPEADAPEIEDSLSAAAPVRAPSPDALRAAGISLLEEEPPKTAPRATLAGVPVPGASRHASPRPGGGEAGAVDRLQRELSEARSTLAARAAEADQHRARADDAAERAEAAESAAAEREAELASVRAKLDAIAAQARKAEQELKTAREEARRGAGELERLRTRLAEAERRAADAANVEELERELESARTELLVARNEVEGARGEVDARTGELKKRIAELEAQGAKNEERVLKAYQKIKGDEKVKDKVRKAIAIAAQLLEEGLPAEPATPPTPEKPRLS